MFRITVYYFTCSYADIVAEICKVNVICSFVYRLNCSDLLYCALFRWLHVKTDTTKGSKYFIVLFDISLK